VASGLRASRFIARDSMREKSSAFRLYFLQFALRADGMAFDK